MGLSNNPTCRKCGTGEKTSVHILCECEALASLRYTHLGSFVLDPEDVRKLGMGASGTLLKEQGSFNLVQNMGHKGPFLRPRCIGPRRARTQKLLNSIHSFIPPTLSITVGTLLLVSLTLQQTSIIRLSFSRRLIAVISLQFQLSIPN